MVEGITDCQDPNGDKEWSLFYIENISVNCNNKLNT